MFNNIIKKILFNHWPLFVIIGLWLLFSSPYFFRGLVPFPSRYLVSFFPPWNAEYGMPVKNNAIPDVISQIYPWKLETIRSWKSNQVPLWNPYSFSGTPHAANYQSAVFSPFNFIFMILNFIDAWSILILLQPILAGLFMYIFLKSGLSLNKISSLIGSVSFMFCGFITTWMPYGTLGYAILFLPLACYAANRFVTTPKFSWGIVLCITVVISLLSGHFQVSLYFVLGLLSFILYLFFTRSKLQKNVLISLVYILIGILISAPQILLTLDAYMDSVRSVNISKGEVIPWNYLPSTIAPDFFGNPVTRNDWFGHYAEWNSYAGSVPFVIAISGLVLTGFNPISIWLLSLALFSFLFTHAGPFVDLMYILKIPVLSTSAASRMIVLFSFSVSILSSVSLNNLLLQKKIINRKLFYVIVGWILLILGIWIWIIFGNPFSPENIGIAKRNFILPSLLIIMTLAALLLMRFKKLGQLVGLILVFITCFEMYRFSSKWMPFEERVYVYPDNQLTEFLSDITGSWRVFGNIGGEVGVTYKLPLIEGYDAMYQARYGKFMNSLSSGNPTIGIRSVVMADKYGKYIKDGMRLMGVKYYVHRISDGRNIWAYPVWQYPDGEMTKIFENSSYEVFEDTKVLPRVFLADSYEVVSDESEWIKNMFTNGKDIRNTVFLDKNPDLIPEMGFGNANIKSYTSNKVIINTSSEVPKLLFLSDPFSAGWKVLIDGVNSKIYRANYNFRAVSIPKGNHEVVFSYHPRGFEVGKYFSFTGIIILAVLFILHKRKSKFI